MVQSTSAGPVRPQTPLPAGRPGPPTGEAQLEDVFHHAGDSSRRMAHDGLTRLANSSAFKTDTPAPEGPPRQAFMHSLRQSGGVLALQGARVGATVAKLYVAAFAAPEEAEAASLKAAHQAAKKAVGETSVHELGKAVDRPQVGNSLRQTARLGLLALADSKYLSPQGEEWHVAP